MELSLPKSSNWRREIQYLILILFGAVTLYHLSELSFLYILQDDNEENHNQKKTAAMTIVKEDSRKLDTTANKNKNDDYNIKHDVISNGSFHLKKLFKNIHDRPRYQDEHLFYHCTESLGCPLPQLHQLGDQEQKLLPSYVQYPNPSTGEKMSTFDSSKVLMDVAKHLYVMFKEYDDRKGIGSKLLQAYGTMCVGDNDCGYIPKQITAINPPGRGENATLVGVGHMIVVVSSGDAHWISFYTALQAMFPGRFTCFIRPKKLGCAEAWNLITRMAFSIQLPSNNTDGQQEGWKHPEDYYDEEKLIGLVYICNADLALKATATMPHPMASYLEFANKNKDDYAIINLASFASFSLTRLGFKELGYFDETLFPAYAEDVEYDFRIRSRKLNRIGFRGAQVHHVRSPSVKNPDNNEFNAKLTRSPREEYVVRKWGVVPKNVKDSSKHPFKHPFNLPFVDHRLSWLVDQRNRKCIESGVGPRYQGKSENKCFWSPEALRQLPGVPSNFVWPKRLTTVASLNK